MEMGTMIAVLAVAFAIELLLYLLPVLWHAKKLRPVLVGILLITNAFALSAVLVLQPSLLIALLCVIGVYRLFNLLRIAEARMHSKHLLRVTRRSAIMLGAAQAACYSGFVWWSDAAIESLTVWYIVAALQLVVATVLLASTIRRLERTRVTEPTTALATSEYPTVSVAIPARNETEDLEACLNTLVANDYPKLEILVLDDCSQNKHTPEIIRQFAHDGVRFLQGEPPAENWLAKNQAYEQLAEAATGEIIMFCGVDTRFEANSIKQVISQMIARQKRMVSIVPLRSAKAGKRSFIQAARYLWELTPPRKQLKRPPVLSTCWAIYRKDLKEFGSFKAVSRAIIPEAYFARRAVESDGYSLLRAGQDAPIESVKSYENQRGTAIRTRYPQLHRRPENVLMFGLGNVLFFVGPYVLFIASLAGREYTLALVALLSIVLLQVMSFLITYATRLQNTWLAAISFLPIVLADTVLMHVSMVKYEFSEVIWKGRNVCIPVMHVIPSLPPMYEDKNTLKSVANS